MTFWAKVRDKAVAWTAIGTATALAGFASYKYFKARQTPKPREAKQWQRQRRCEAVISSGDCKRKALLDDLAPQHRHHKRSRTDSDPTVKVQPGPDVEEPLILTNGGTKSRSFYTNLPSSTQTSSASKSSRSQSSDCSTRKTSAESEIEDGAARFEAVCSHIDVDAMESIALRVRKDRLRVELGSAEYESLTNNMTCEFGDSPMYGSYNIVYPLLFSDGVMWLVRIPGHGHSFQSLDKIKMDSEYQTMRYIKQNTSILIPEVYYWSFESDNEVGSAFAFIEQLEGHPLCQVWKTFDQTKRLRTLKRLAKMMAQLQFHHFDRIGMLRFNEEGNPIEVDSEISLANEVGAELPWEGEHRTAGPFESFEAKLDATWDNSNLDEYENVLRMAGDSIPPCLVPDTCNTLSMPDLDTQNILVDDEGSITGIIDWDGVGTAPTAVGCGRYPNWLRTDYGPWYDYDAEADALEDPHMDPSPEEMNYYRRYYATVFAKYSRGVKEYNPRMTHVSHLLWAIEVAIKHEFGRHEVVEHLLNRAFGGIYPANVAQEQIEEAFAKMWHAEWIEPEPDYGSDVE